MGSPHDALGALQQIPRELWSNVTKFMSPQEIARLKQTGKTVSDELDLIKYKVPADKWKTKLAKLEALRLEIFERNVKLNAFAKALRALPSLDKPHFDTIDAFLKEELPVYENALKLAKDKSAKLKLRKTLEPAQTAELDQYMARLEMAEKTHVSQMHLIMGVIADKRKVVVPGTKRV
jgi:hypothetical protein